MCVQTNMKWTAAIYASLDLLEWWDLVFMNVSGALKGEVGSACT